MRSALLILGLAVGLSQANVLKYEPSGARDIFNMLQKTVQDIAKDPKKLESIKDAIGSVNLGSLIKPEATEGKPEVNEDTAEVTEDGYETPSFCRKLACPKFKVIEDDKEYQLREYPATSWVSTQLSGVDFKKAQYTMFMKLFSYISGKNQKKEKVTMTCPVIVRIIPGQGPACENNFTMSFFNDPAAPDHPQPSSADVALTSLPPLRAYVRSFGGFASKEDWLNEAVKLKEALPADAKYITDFYYTGGYDSPFTLFNRHNEVWFIAK